MIGLPVTKCLDLSSFDPGSTLFTMSDWDTSIRRAQFDGNGDAITETTVTPMEYCVHLPHVWQSDDDGHLCLRCIGWAVSPGDEPIRVRVAGRAGVMKWVRPVTSRPDVVATYRRRGVDVSEFVGFDFLLDVDLAADGGSLTLDVLAPSFSSGPLEIDVAALYQAHRETLRREADSAGDPALIKGRGRLDQAEGSRVFGWAQAPGSSVPAAVVLYLNGERCAETLADRYREDLARVGFSANGRIAFEFELERTLVPGDVVSVAIEGGEELNNSPIEIT